MTLNLSTAGLISVLVSRFTWSVENMTTTIFYIIFFVVTRSYTNSESKVNYYENLIKENVQSASTYKLPEDAAQYKPANSSIKSKYYLILFI